MLAYALAIAALVASSPFIARADDAGHMGRYQLLYAVTETSGSGPAIQTKTVWKIDTVTGQVWQFVSSTVGDKLRERFIPVETSQP
jgi:hypothetical protein